MAAYGRAGRPEVLLLEWESALDRAEPEKVALDNRLAYRPPKESQAS